MYCNRLIWAQWFYAQSLNFLLINKSCMSCAQKLEVSPAYLRNDGNEYLHYTDDWYILDSQPDKYVVIYYRGNNDAWKGYGGATIYTRCVHCCVWAVSWCLSARWMWCQGVRYPVHSR